MAAHFAHGPVAQVLPGLGGLIGKVITVTSLKYIPLFGIGIVFYHCRRTEHSSALCLVASATCVLALSLMESGVAAMIDLVLAVVLWCAVSGKVSWLAARPLVWLGAISYTLYLTHQNIGYIVIRNLEAHGAHPLLAILVAVILSVALAVAMHHLVEHPLFVYLT